MGCCRRPPLRELPLPSFSPSSSHACFYCPSSGFQCTYLLAPCTPFPRPTREGFSPLASLTPNAVVLYHTGLLLRTKFPGSLPGFWLEAKAEPC